MAFSWATLPKPFFALAPMEDVTDTVFRQVVAKCALPDVFFTEFTNCDGLMSAGRAMAMQRLQHTSSERPIIAQLWGVHPANFYKSAQHVVEMGFDGIDINMGCPQRKIVKDGSCAALIKNPKLAAEIISAVRKGAGKVPVSVKTRIGFNKIISDEWIGFLLEQKLDALTVHVRTAAEMSKVAAHWEEFGKVVQLRNQLKVPTVIIGNGDIKNQQQGRQLVDEYGIDGVMIGRGIFENLWVFAKEPPEPKPLSEMLDLLLIHARLFQKTWGSSKHFLILRRFFKIYVHGFPYASELREKLVQTSSLEEVEEIVKGELSRHRQLVSAS